MPMRPPVRPRNLSKHFIEALVSARGNTLAETIPGLDSRFLLLLPLLSSAI
jgi:hypothetical protein